VLSALAHPFSSVGQVDAYPTVCAKAAALFRGLVKNHGLHDGNKRLAVTTLTVFLLANGRSPLYTNSQLYRYTLRVARHRGEYSNAQTVNHLAVGSNPTAGASFPSTN
jgi:prophage maintenance system killer protein